MKKKKSPRASKGTRSLRGRPVPKWLKTTELDEMARRRCLLILSVLSGTTPVSSAIEEAKISRGTYYQLETKAIKAMLQALMPGAETDGAGEPLLAQVSRMEARIKTLEKEKRRSERLLYLTRQVLRPGPLKTDKGPRRGRRKSTTTEPSLTKRPSSPSPSPSTQTATGTAAR